MGTITESGQDVAEVFGASGQDDPVSEDARVANGQGYVSKLVCLIKKSIFMLRIKCKPIVIYNLQNCFSNYLRNIHNIYVGRKKVHLRRNTHSQNNTHENWVGKLLTG